MQRFKIHSIVNRQGYLIAVFRFEGEFWQCRVITPDGTMLGEEELYHSTEAAERAARTLLWA